jgi:predicted SnoaL-like aldol condensation-catalyzing enzyme
MRICSLRDVLVMTISTIAAASSARTPDQALTQVERKEAVVRLLKSFAGSDPGALSIVNANRYTQHNLRLEDGLEGLKKRLASPQPDSSVQVIRVLADGDYIVTHSEFNFGKSFVAFDIFRFEHNQIVEHWDNLEPKCELPNASGRTQLDGPTEVQDLGETAANKALLREYFQVVVIGGKRDRVDDYRKKFHQHNCYGEDDKSGGQATSGPFAKPGFVYRVDRVHTVVGEGNFVLVVNEGLFDAKPAMFYDFYRVHRHLIVEHWDVIEAIPPKDEWKNPNGKF